LKIRKKMTFYSFPTDDVNDKVGKNPLEKDWRRFSWVNKTRPEGLGWSTPARKTLWCLYQYSVYTSDVENKYYSLDLNVP